MSPSDTRSILQGIDNAEIIETLHARRQPMIAVSTPLTALMRTSRDAARRAKRNWLAIVVEAEGDFEAPAAWARLRVGWNEPDDSSQATRS